MLRFLNTSLSEHHFCFLFSFIALYQVLPQQSGFYLMCIFTRMPCVHTHTHISSSLTPLSIPYWMFLFTKVHLPTTRVLTWVPSYHFFFSTTSLSPLHVFHLFTPKCLQPSVMSLFFSSLSSFSLCIKYLNFYGFK